VTVPKKKSAPKKPAAKPRPAAKPSPSGGSRKALQAAADKAKAKKAPAKRKRKKAAPKFPAQKRVEALEARVENLIAVLGNRLGFQIEPQPAPDPELVEEAEADEPAPSEPNSPAEINAVIVNRLGFDPSAEPVDIIHTGVQGESTTIPAPEVPAE
jgi:hypothetical protein